MLKWFKTEHGLAPQCTECADLMTSPMWQEAVHSVSLETGENPERMNRRAINTYHANGHMR